MSYKSSNIDETDIKKIQNTNLENEAICNLNKSIFQDIDVAIVFYNTDEKILHVNPYFCQTFGFQSDKVIGKPISSIYYI